MSEIDNDLDLDVGEAPAAVIPNPAALVHTPKNFRHHPDMENFYRFIHENDLRTEALEIIDAILDQRQKDVVPMQAAPSKKK